MGKPDLLMSARAILFRGIRTAIVPRPPVVILGTMFDFFKTRVTGPGQNFLIILISLGDISLTNPLSVFMSAIWTINGLSEGLPLI